MTPAYAQAAAAGADYTSDLYFPTLLIGLGLIGYAIEKYLDLRNEIKKEKRAAFTAFVRAQDRMINHRHLSTDPAEHSKVIMEAKETLNELYLRARSGNLEKCVNAAQAARLLANSLGQPGDSTPEQTAYNVAMTSAVNAARREFGLSKDALSTTVVEAFLLSPETDAPDASAAANPKDAP